jgi:hypothetical protein
MTGPHRHPTPEQRAAFRAFVRAHHPDRGGDPATFAAGVDAMRSDHDAGAADRPDTDARPGPVGPLPFPVRVGVAVLRTWRRRHERSGPP